MSSHAEALVACARGVRRAERDFNHGRRLVNPFPASEPMQRAGWDGRVRALICQRDHGVDLCCQEHRQHRSQTTRSFWTLSCCAHCETEMTPLIDAEHARLAALRNVASDARSGSAVRVPRQRSQRN